MYVIYTIDHFFRTAAEQQGPAVLKHSDITVHEWVCPESFNIVRRNKSYGNVTYKEGPEALLTIGDRCYSIRIGASDPEAIPWTTQQWLFLLRHLRRFHVTDEVVRGTVFWPSRLIPWPESFPPLSPDSVVRLSLHLGGPRSILLPTSAPPVEKKEPAAGPRITAKPVPLVPPPPVEPIYNGQPYIRFDAGPNSVIVYMEGSIMFARCLTDL